MAQPKIKNYSVLDHPQVTQYLFHPRPEGAYRQIKDTRKDLMISVDNGAQIGASFHFVKNDAPVILFFHGNGEIVSDYDDFGILFNDVGLNFFVADYRGYGISTGVPSVTSMMKDCYKIFDFVLEYMSKENLTGPLIVMGRSLGSASAIELCSTRSNDFNCVIIESGFAYASPLLQTLGIDPESIGFKEQQGFENIDKIRMFSKPCLVIHAQYDHIIPFSDGQALFDACTSNDKKLLEIKGANHNDIFLKGMNPYLKSLKEICFF
ncbi:MAG: alpha/beta hydrolase [Desulfobacteraceae bacterium]|nr:alpha/beta hydrolase [Desulfobacteraceae bacterium]